MHNPKEGWHYDSRGENHYLYGKHHTEKTKQKISKTLKGKTLTKEHRKKISKATKGKNNPFYGKTHTKKIKQKLSNLHSGKNSPRARAVIHLKTGKTYDTMQEAEKETGENHRTISYHCLGKSCKNNPRWKYAEDVTEKTNYYVERSIEHIKTGRKFSTQKEAGKAFNYAHSTVYNHCKNKVQNPEFKYYKEKIMWEK